MAEEDVVYQGESGAINMACPSEDCKAEMKCEVKILYRVQFTDEGLMQLEIRTDLDTGPLTDHAVFEHGWLGALEGNKNEEDHHPDPDRPPGCERRIRHRLLHVVQGGLPVLRELP